MINFTNLEGMLYYLLLYYESNSNIPIYDFIETLIKFLITDMDNYTVKDLEQIDLDDKKNNIAKLLIRLTAMIYSTPHQLIFTNIILSVILDTKLHTLMNNIYKKIFDKEYNFKFNIIPLYILSKKSVIKYSTYLKEYKHRYKPLYYNIFQQYYPNMIPTKYANNNIKIPHIFGNNGGIENWFDNNNYNRYITNGLYDKNNWLSIYGLLLQKKIIMMLMI